MKEETEGCFAVPAPETEPKPLEDIADLLREELRECHHFIRSCFADAASVRNDFDTQQNSMKLAARLIQSSASLAIALKRLEGTRQDIVVTHAAEAAG
ncbi:MAG TPA: hypothetical protein VHL34_09575 [Rhizomicrobium sp.]|jgi:hypothetical protein|nr:hypothetical protein [Rhizomicrobium sp.]